MTDRTTHTPREPPSDASIKYAILEFLATHDAVYLDIYHHVNDFHGPVSANDFATLMVDLEKQKLIRRRYEVKEATEVCYYVRERT